MTTRSAMATTADATSSLGGEPRFGTVVASSIGGGDSTDGTTATLAGSLKVSTSRGLDSVKTTRS